MNKFQFQNSNLIYIGILSLPKQIYLVVKAVGKVSDKELSIK